MTAPALLRPGSVVLDCPDPEALAGFYGTLLGWGPVTVEHEGHWANLENPAGGLAIEFQRVADYQAPTWPDPALPQQFHFDFKVTDMAAAAEHAVASGARPLDLSDEHPTFQVYADPDGHPFCLCAC
jgi:catechol 2,3-dioxygenase-like lactoylglutathione lyase family enzyme